MGLYKILGFPLDISILNAVHEFDDRIIAGFSHPLAV